MTCPPAGLKCVASIRYKLDRNYVAEPTLACLVITHLLFMKFSGPCSAMYMKLFNMSVLDANNSLWLSSF